MSQQRDDGRFNFVKRSASLTYNFSKNKKDSFSRHRHYENY